MRTNIKNRRRVQLLVEPLEGKALLSAGAVVHHVAHHHVAPKVATSVLTGTLSGHYYDLHVPSFGEIQTLNVGGSLKGVGGSNLIGGLSAPTTPVAGNFDSHLGIYNLHGAMVLNVFQTATAGTYTFKVAYADGSDAGLKGDAGTLTLTQTPHFTGHYLSYGSATLTFTASGAQS
jgi:hypothetical protein